MKIIATQTTGKELKPGDLYSHMPQAHWDKFCNPQSLGESLGGIVYIRTNLPTPEYAMETTTYKIEVIK